MNQRYDVASTTIQEESSTSRNDSGLSQRESDKAKKKEFCFRKSAGWKFYYDSPAREVKCVSEYMFLI